jgi:hypothetical protein
MNQPRYDDDVLDAVTRYVEAHEQMVQARGTPGAWVAFCRLRFTGNLAAHQRDGLHWMYLTGYDGGRCTCGLILPATVPDVLAVPGHRDPQTRRPDAVLMGEASRPEGAQGWWYRVLCQACGWQQSPLSSVRRARRLIAEHRRSCRHVPPAADA